MAVRVAMMHYAGPPIIGGVEMTLAHHARWLRRLGYQVCVIAGRGQAWEPDIPFYLVPEADSRHPEVLDIGQALARGEVPPAFEDLKGRLEARLEPILREVDVVVAHNVVTLHKNLPLTAALYALHQRLGFPLLAWSHDFAWHDELYIPHMHPGYPWDLLRTPWPGVRYVAVSEHRRAILAQLLGIPQAAIAVVPPGVDVAEFFKWEPTTRRLVEQLDLLRADPLLLLPARITRRKNIEMGIRITAALLRFMPDAVLVVTGPPGPHNPTNVAYLEQLKDLRERLGVTQRVHFLYEYGEEGRPLEVSHGMMTDFYFLADVLLFPSRKEGFGIPVLEAGLARMPIFAADLPPIRESAGALAVYFNPEGEPYGVARTLAERLAEDPIYRMRKRVLRHFTWEVIVRERVIPLLEEVLEDGAGTPTG